MNRLKNKKYKMIFKFAISIFLIFYLMENCLAEIKLKTEAEVSVYADSITGFKNIKGITKSFKRVDINDDNTPFLHKQINGKNVWVGEYKNFNLELYSTSRKDKYNRNFKVYIDANDGTLLKITSKYEGHDPNLLPEPNAATAERQLKDANYIGFPKEPPKVSFLDALGVADTTHSDPLNAKEIDALYIWYSDTFHQPMRVWIISTRGQTPIQIRGIVGIPDKALDELSKRNNFFRVFIDADTGKALFGDNIIRPEYPEKTKK